MRVRALVLILPFALAACDVRSDDGNANVHIGLGAGDASGDNVHLTLGGKGDHVAINVPGFNAEVKIPGVDMTRNIDMDGVKLAPDSDVKTMDVNGTDEGHDRGTVHITFSNPRAAGAVLDYYRGALAKADYRIGTTTVDGIEARKNDKSFTLKISPDGSGSRGTIAVSSD